MNHNEVIYDMEAVAHLAVMMASGAILMMGQQCPEKFEKINHVAWGRRDRFHEWRKDVMARNGHDS